MSEATYFRILYELISFLYKVLPFAFGISLLLVILYAYRYRTTKRELKDKERSNLIKSTLFLVAMLIAMALVYFLAGVVGENPVGHVPIPSVPVQNSDI